MLSEIKQKPTLIIHFAIVLFMCFVFPQLTPLVKLTSSGMALLGAFLGAAWGWSTIGLIWPSFAGLLSLGWFLGFEKIATAGFGNTTVVMLFFMFMATGCLTETGAINWLIQKLLSLKFFLGKPWVTIGFFFFLAYIIASLNGVVMALILVPFMSSLFKTLGIEPYGKLPTLMILGIMYSLLMGQVTFPFIGNGFILVSTYSMMYQVPIDFVSFLMFSFPLSVAMILIYIALMRFVFKVDVTPFKNLTSEVLGECPRITRDQKISFVVLIVIICCMLGTTLTFLGPINRLLQRLTIVGYAIAIMFVMVLVKNEKGNPFINTSAATPWEIILITAMVMILSADMGNPDFGITASIIALVQPMMGLSPYVFIISLLALSVIITHFASNLVLTIVLMPVMVTFAANIGMNPIGIVVLLFFTCQMSLATPGGGAPISAIFYGMEDWVQTGTMSKYGLKLIPFLFIGDVILGLTWANIIF